MNLSGFNENGSDLAQGAQGMESIYPGLPLDADFSFRLLQLTGWAVTPTVAFGGHWIFFEENTLRFFF